MNKPELVAKVARETGVSKTVARKAVDAFAKAVMNVAGSEGTIDMAGLGSLSFVTFPTTGSTGLVTGRKVPAGALVLDAPNTTATGTEKAAISLEPSQYLTERVMVTRPRGKRLRRVPSQYLTELVTVTAERTGGRVKGTLIKDAATSKGTSVAAAAYNGTGITVRRRAGNIGRGAAAGKGTRWR